MQNLGNLLPDGPLTALIGSSSMAGGNTISDESGAMTAPGSESETTTFAVKTGKPEVAASGPERPVGTDPSRKADNHSYSPRPASWQALPDNGYSKETP